LKDNVSGVTFASWGGDDGVNLKVDPMQAMRCVMCTTAVFPRSILTSLASRSTSAEASAKKKIVRKASSRCPELWTLAIDLSRDPNVIGRSVELKGEPYTVVGILPQSAVYSEQRRSFYAIATCYYRRVWGDNCGILVRLQVWSYLAAVNAQLEHVRLPYFSEIETNLMAAHGSTPSAAA